MIDEHAKNYTVQWPNHSIAIPEFVYINFVENDAMRYISFLNKHFDRLHI